MRVFLTGATGFIGSAIARELIRAGHRVLGMARSHAGAVTLRAAGVEVHHGDLKDVETLKQGASQADAVVHCAFDNDVSRLVAASESDQHAIRALGLALSGTERPLIVTSVTGLGAVEPGSPATEDVLNTSLSNPRAAAEVLCASLVGSGVNLSIVRNPQVHDRTRQGLVTPLIAFAKEKRVSAYVGEGLQRWPAAHVSDVANLYVLALNKGQRGARYHAVAEDGVVLKDIAEAIGCGLDVPVMSLSSDEAAEHFGSLFMFAGLDMPASSAKTRDLLGWQPTGPGLLSDLIEMEYAGG